MPSKLYSGVGTPFEADGWEARDDYKYKVIGHWPKINGQDLRYDVIKYVNEGGALLNVRSRRKTRPDEEWVNFTGTCSVEIPSTTPSVKLTTTNTTTVTITTTTTVTKTTTSSSTTNTSSTTSTTTTTIKHHNPARRQNLLYYRVSGILALYFQQPGTELLAHSGLPIDDAI
jgi:hypothetical protein